jgi:cytidylate kinase
MNSQVLKKIVIAIDGPAASGKSTTARLVAEKLGYLHIDTGAMYRALTADVLEKKIDLDDEGRIVQLAKTSKIRLERVAGNMRIFLNEDDVTEKIRTPLVNRSVSTISSYKGVREVMVQEQRKMAGQGGVVLEGRDIGTVVLPSAELKVFMVASVEERANRRRNELVLNGIETDAKELIKEIESRDRKDSTREVSPLVKAPDAIELDTTHLTIEEQVDFIVTRARKIIQQEKVLL